MNFNYTLKYRTFDQLMSDVRVDFQNMSLEQQIEDQQLIKIVKKVNYDLGLRIFMTKEAVLEVEKGRVRLPEDFYVLNFGLVCGQYSITFPVPQGTHLEERSIVPKYQCQPSTIDTCSVEPEPDPCQPCGQCEPCQNAQPCGQCHKPRVCLDCKGGCYELIQVVKTETRVYKEFFPLRFRDNPIDIDCDCPNTRWNCHNHAWIKDGWLLTNFKTGKVYINYQGALEDDNGNLLVPDHDLLNDYYEYAVKERLLENLAMNDEAVERKLAIIIAKLRTARTLALNVVNTPNFEEMRKMMEVNRKAQYQKYYYMFSGYGLPGYNTSRGHNRHLR